MKKDKFCPICGKELIKYETQPFFGKNTIQTVWYCSDINCPYKQEEKIIDMYPDLVDDTMWGIFEYADPELGWGKSGGYINVVKAKTEKEALKKVFPEKGYMEYGAENVTEEDIDNQIDEYTEIINALKQNIKILENARKEIAK